MKSIKNLSLLLLICLLVACGSKPGKAPVEDRTRLRGTSGPVTPAATRVEDSQSQYMVKKGDTLYRIAMEKGQSYTDIILWNNLTNPDDIKIGQILRVTPPEISTSGVVSPSGIEVRPLGAGMAKSVTAPSGNNKNGPRADKRPYSDTALAELQKNETTDAVSGKVSVIPAEKVVEKISNPAIADEIFWVWPVEGKVAKYFDDNKNKGVDFFGKSGQDVYAAAAGTVMYAGSGIRGYGNLVIIKHSNNYLSAYAHNQMIIVREKQIIGKGQKIAEMGNSDSDVVKLHFEIRQQGRPVDPMKFLPGR